jgi:hypothetical protein
MRTHQAGQSILRTTTNEDIYKWLYFISFLSKCDAEGKILINLNEYNFSTCLYLFIEIISVEELFDLSVSTWSKLCLQTTFRSLENSNWNQCNASGHFLWIILVSFLYRNFCWRNQKPNYLSELSFSSIRIDGCTLLYALWPLISYFPPLLWSTELTLLSSRIKDNHSPFSPKFYFPLLSLLVINEKDFVVFYLSASL